MADVQTPVDMTQTTPANSVPSAGDISFLKRGDNVMQKQVWHFVTVGVIAAVVVGFFLGRLSKT